MRAFTNFGNTFRAGYNYQRSFRNPMPNTGNLTTMNMNNLAFNLGRATGAVVNLSLNVASKLFSAGTVVGRWLRNNVVSPLRTAVRNTPVMMKKIFERGKLVGIKIVNVVKAIGKEAKGIAKDAADRFTDIKKNTQAIYKLKKDRYMRKHNGDQPSFGTKARYAYDASVKGRADAAHDAVSKPAHSKIVQATRDFRKAANSAVGSFARNMKVRLKDAALLAAGIYGLAQVGDSKEEPLEV